MKVACIAFTLRLALFCRTLVDKSNTIVTVWLIKDDISPGIPSPFSPPQKPLCPVVLSTPSWWRRPMPSSCLWGRFRGIWKKRTSSRSLSSLARSTSWQWLRTNTLACTKVSLHLTCLKWAHVRQKDCYILHTCDSGADRWLASPALLQITMETVTVHVYHSFCKRRSWRQANKCSCYKIPFQKQAFGLKEGTVSYLETFFLLKKSIN